MAAENLHRHCFACREVDGLGLSSEPAEGGGVIAEWYCAERYQSYPGIVHGGIVATLLDAAMTQCLLAKGIIAVTGRLSVEYHAPLQVGALAVVSASIDSERPPLYMLSAEIQQEGILVAEATAKFMRSESDWR